MAGGDSRDCGVPEDDLEATVFESCHARHLRPESIKQGYKPGRTLLHGDGRRASGDRGDTPDPGRARTTRSPAARSRRSTSAGEYPRRDHPGAERRAIGSRCLSEAAGLTQRELASRMRTGWLGSRRSARGRRSRRDTYDASARSSCAWPHDQRPVLSLATDGIRFRIEPQPLRRADEPIGHSS